VYGHARATRPADVQSDPRLAPARAAARSSACGTASPLAGLRKSRSLRSGDPYGVSLRRLPSGGVRLVRHRPRPDGGTDKEDRMNSVQLIGRLTRDPEVRETSGGTTVCRMGLAIQRRERDAGPVY